jgi:hypothetical protein
LASDGKRRAMRALIDESVFHAKKYYQTYLSEPSPAGDFSLSLSGIASEEHLDLVRVLQEIKDIGAGGELLVVTHSDPKGFLMPLKAKGKVSLLFEVMDKILKIAEGIRRHEAIRPVPPKQAPDAWKKWFADFEPGIKLEPGFETNPDWHDFVEKQFDAWFERQGRDILKLPDPRGDLKELLDLLKDVRSLGFKRLEFRACQIGADKTAMEKIAAFLNVKIVVGPTKVETFYGTIPHSDIGFIADDGKRSAALKRIGGRTFPKISMGLLVLPRAFKVIAENDDALKAFVQGYIRAKYSGSVSPFVVGGVNSVGRSVTKYVFPLEPDYKTLLVKFDAAAAKSVTP